MESRANSSELSGAVPCAPGAAFGLPPARARCGALNQPLRGSRSALVGRSEALSEAAMGTGSRASINEVMRNAKRLGFFDSMQSWDDIVAEYGWPMTDARMLDARVSPQYLSTASLDKSSGCQAVHTIMRLVSTRPQTARPAPSHTTPTPHPFRSS